MNIDLGEVTTSHINREHHSDKKPVNIRLINCDIAGWDDGNGGVVSKVGVTFDSTAKTTGATPLLSNISAGEATGVGVRLMNKDEIILLYWEQKRQQLTYWQVQQNKR